MSPNAVRNAVRHGNQSVTEIVATGYHGRCSRRYVPSVVRIPRFPLNLGKVDQFIAVSVTVRSD